jgi:hypothetical protein
LINIKIKKNKNNIFYLNLLIFLIDKIFLRKLDSQRKKLINRIKNSLFDNHYIETYIKLYENIPTRFNTKDEEARLKAEEEARLKAEEEARLKFQKDGEEFLEQNIINKIKTIEYSIIEEISKFKNVQDKIKKILYPTIYALRNIGDIEKIYQNESIEFIKENLNEIIEKLFSFSIYMFQNTNIFPNNIILDNIKKFFINIKELVNKVYTKTIQFNSNLMQEEIFLSLLDSINKLKKIAENELDEEIITLSKKIIRSN